MSDKYKYSIDVEIKTVVYDKNDVEIASYAGIKEIHGKDFLDSQLPVRYAIIKTTTEIITLAQIEK